MGVEGVAIGARIGAFLLQPARPGTARRNPVVEQHWPSAPAQRLQRRGAQGANNAQRGVAWRSAAPEIAWRAGAGEAGRLEACWGCSWRGCKRCGCRVERSQRSSRAEGRQTADSLGNHPVSDPVPCPGNAGSQRPASVPGWYARPFNLKWPLRLQMSETVTLETSLK